MLTTLFGPARRAMTTGDLTNTAFWSSFSGRRTLAGSRVSEDLALTYSAVWRCTRILAEAIAGLPLITYRRIDGDGREPATDLAVFDLLKTSPNPDMGAVPFREGRSGHQVNWGGGFAEIETDYRTGEPVNLWPIHPARVRPTWVTDTIDRDEYPYCVQNADQSWLPMKREEMLHIPGVFSEDGIWGKGTIAYAREAIGGAFAVERHGFSYFGSGAQPKGVLNIPGMSDPEARRNFRREWKEVHGSPDSNEIAILPVEGKFSPITISMEDSQFLQTRKFNVGEVARWYGVPAHMVGEYEKAAAYASVEAQGIEFIIYSLMAWLRKWEDQLNLKLLSRAQRSQYFIEHNLAGLVRGDLKTRMEAYRTALQIGIMTINECRRLENLPTIGEAGDENYVQLNMTTAKAMHESPPRPGDKVAGANPFGKPPAGDGQNPIDGADGASEGAFDAWTRKAVRQLAARASGKQVRRRSILIHANAGTDSKSPALLAVPDYRQDGDYDCGAAATHSVCDFFGVGNGRQAVDYIEELGTTRTAGTRPDAIEECLATSGLNVLSGPGMTTADLAAHHLAGRPVICPIQLYETKPDQEAKEQVGHYVVVVGVSGDMVFYQDPAAGRRAMTAMEFDQRWHDRDADGNEYDHYGIASSKATASAPESANALKTAARVVLLEVLTRYASKESLAAKRAAKGDFLAWLDDFYPKHREQLAAALRPTAEVLNAIGVTFDAASAATKLCAAHRAKLQAAYDTATPAQFAATLAAWPAEMAASGMAEVMGDNR
jgi:HK97 family phage portal protein